MSSEGDKSCPVHFDRHSSDYRERFAGLTRDLHTRCPIAWSDAHGGHWVASGYKEVFEIARNATLLSNDHDVEGLRKGYQGISIPIAEGLEVRGGFLEMDPPEQRDYRRAIDPYLSPAAVSRWRPMIEDVTRAALDEKIETGSIDFVDDLANIVPAVMTMAILGLPLADWVVYCEPAHAQVYTPPDSPGMARVIELMLAMIERMMESIAEMRRNPKPGIVNALIESSICGQPPADKEIVEALTLLIGGGFDTTTALTAHSLEWLSEHPAERERLRSDLPGLLDSATEEFLRFYTPAPGDGRTVTTDYELSGKLLEEGDRLYLSFAMANRDPDVFPDPDSVHIDRPRNRHTSFGLGVHRCIGSNLARTVFKIMLTAVLERLPDFRCDPSGTERYDTVGVINGMKHLPATFTPGRRLGTDLHETLSRWQQAIDEQKLAAPVTRSSAPDSVQPA